MSIEGAEEVMDGASEPGAPLVPINMTLALQEIVGGTINVDEPDDGVDAAESIGRDLARANDISAELDLDVEFKRKFGRAMDKLYPEWAPGWKVWLEERYNNANDRVHAVCECMCALDMCLLEGASLVECFVWCTRRAYARWRVLR